MYIHMYMYNTCVYTAPQRHQSLPSHLPAEQYNIQGRRREKGGKKEGRRKEEGEKKEAKTILGTVQSEIKHHVTHQLLYNTCS